MKQERLYVSPLAFPLEDTLAVQAAVDAAEKTDIRVVAIPPKPDGTAWRLRAPVLLPSYITVILDGAVVEAEGTAFMNANATDPALQGLGGEQHKIFPPGAFSLKKTNRAAVPLLISVPTRSTLLSG